MEVNPGERSCGVQVIQRRLSVVEHCLDVKRESLASSVRGLGLLIGLERVHSMLLAKARETVADRVLCLQSYGLPADLIHPLAGEG